MVFNLQTHRNLIFITLFIITSCASKQKINFNNQNEVKVIFEKPTENYQVIAFWKPSYIKNKLSNHNYTTNYLL